MIFLAVEAISIMCMICVKKKTFKTTPENNDHAFTLKKNYTLSSQKCNLKGPT